MNDTKVTLTTTDGTSNNWYVQSDHTQLYTYPHYPSNGHWKWVPDLNWPNPYGPWPEPWPKPSPYKPWTEPWPSPIIKPKKIKRKRAPVKKQKKSMRANVKGRKETYITLVLDRSGSMYSCYAAALDAINEQIETIKKNAHKGGKTYVSLLTFDNEIDVVFENVLAQEVKHLTPEDYVLGGSTALRDAVMTAIETMEEFESSKKNQGFLMILISDGQENASGTPQEELQRRIEELDADKWTFTYMLDGHTWEQVQAFSVAYASPIGNMSTYTADSAGTLRSSHCMAAGVVNYMDSRGEGETKSKTFYNDGSGEESKV